MKRLLFLELIISTVIILSLSSCTKEQLHSPSLSGGGNNNTSPPITLELTAGHWDEYPGGFYTIIFQNVIPGNYAGNNGSSIKVYLLTEKGEQQINHSIVFRNGDLWATIFQSDLRLNYRSYGNTLPFTFLNIKVVFK